MNFQRNIPFREPSGACRPLSLGVTALEIPSQKERFSLPHLKWVKGPAAGSAAEGLQWVHPRTGASLPPRSVPARQGDLEAEKEVEAWQRLFTYSAESLCHKELAAFILQREGHQTRQEIAYLGTQAFFCLGYHLQKENDRFMIFLVTYTPGGEPLGKHCLAPDAVALGEPGFFTLGGKLFVLPEASKLVSYSF